MKLLKKSLLGIVAAIGLATASQAAVIDLTFEGVNATYPSGYANVGDFYNGGTSSDGTSGTNYGISFSSNALAICLNSTSVLCSNTSRGGFGDPNSQTGGLFFLEGAQTYMNVAAGFDTGFSFNYAAIYYASSVSVYDGLNGTGNLLATIALGLTTTACDPSYSAGFCPFVAAGIGFAGIAKSVSFAGVSNQVVFDDVTFGSATPGPSPTPLPAGLPLLAVGLGGLAVLRRKARKS